MRTTRSATRSTRGRSWLISSTAVQARAGGFDHTVSDKPTVHDYLAFLREAGFVEAGTVWQVGDDRVLVGIR